MRPSWSAKGWGPASCWKKIIRVPEDDDTPVSAFLDPPLSDRLLIAWKRFQLFPKGTQQFIQLLKQEKDALEPID